MCVPIRFLLFWASTVQVCLALCCHSCQSWRDFAHRCKTFTTSSILIKPSYQKTQQIIKLLPRRNHQKRSPLRWKLRNVRHFLLVIPSCHGLLCSQLPCFLQTTSPFIFSNFYQSLLLGNFGTIHAECKIGALPALGSIEEAYINVP